MYLSEHFGRAFWIDDNSNDFTSCPLKVNNEPDFDYIDYVSEWEDLEGVSLDKLFNIHRIELLYKQFLDSKVSDSDFILTEDVYNEVKKCYNSSNPEEVIWHGN